MATKQQIIALPNSRLRHKSQRVGFITDEIRQIIEDMRSAALDWESTRQHEVGVALAAIQIDKPYRIIIIRQNLEDKNDKRFSVLINPEIVKQEGEIEEDYEGCLSVSDIYGQIPRYSIVRLKAIDENGHETRYKARDFLARVLQHEVDHLNGIMFVDHIKDKPEAFYKITNSGKLRKLPYEKVKQAGIFR